jgi:hypothetical protein
LAALVQAAIGGYVVGEEKGNQMDTTRSTTRRDLAPVQIAAALVGAAFLIVGIAGFIPGLTTHFSDLTWAGMHSDARVLGLFQTSVLHNIVHLLFGVLGLLLARRGETARLYLLVGGVIYLALVIYGLLIDPMSSANFVPLNTADNWLHLIIGIAMLGLGLGLPINKRTQVAR